MTSADCMAPNDVLRHRLSLIVADTAEERTERLAATLEPLRGQPVRLVRVANPLQAKLSLKRILIQVGHAEDTGTTDAARIMQALIGALSTRQGTEDHVLLVVEGAETLEPEAALSLQTLAATLKDKLPALHVLLVGSPSISELGIVTDAPPASSARPLTAEAAERYPGSANAELIRKPLTWRRTLARAGLAAVPLGFMLAWTYHSWAPRTQHAALVIPAAVSTPPPPPASAPAQVEEAAAPPMLAPQPVVSQEAQRVRLRADFDQFLASSGKATARLTRSQRDALFQEYLTWRAAAPR